MVDAQIYAEPWGFALEMCVFRFDCAWQARSGFSVTWPKKSQAFADCKARFVDGGGPPHYSLPFATCAKSLRT